MESNKVETKPKLVKWKLLIYQWRTRGESNHQEKQTQRKSQLRFADKQGIVFNQDEFKLKGAKFSSRDLSMMGQL